MVNYIEPNLQDIIFTPITRIGSRFDHSETQKIDIFGLDPLEREVCGGSSPSSVKVTNDFCFWALVLKLKSLHYTQLLRMRMRMTQQQQKQKQKQKSI
jgi:hypothetical protein